MNQMRLKIGLLVVALAGGALAEWPTSTEKPAQAFSRWASFPIERESLSGKVIEIEKSDADLYVGPQGYFAMVRRNEPYFCAVFDVPKEGLFNLYHQKESPGSIYILVTEKLFESEKLLFASSRQQFELIALGDDYIRNDDKTVRYIWSDIEMPDFENKEFWTFSELLVFAEYLAISEPVITVRCNQAHENELIRDETSREISCLVSSCSGSILERMKVIIPEDGVDFIVTEDKSRKQIKFYAKVCESEEGELMLRAVGRRRKGKGDKATYKW